ncbi:META domain-containing protein [Streptomyces sp. NPDC091292]|uniref:META domain-containing protein n=1 Tax=Streptomyces sp. NPDC091292 TaxID=3365991 RepID=UPI0038115B04
MYTQRPTLISTVGTLAAAGLLTACGTATGDGSGAGSGTVDTSLPLTGVHWNVRDLTVAGKTYKAPDGSHVRIEPDGTTSGTLGCNRFHSTAEIKDGTVSFGDTATTQIGCPKQMMAYEELLAKALGAGRLTAKVAAGTLTLTTPDGDRIALTEEKPAPLTGTEWTVTSLVRNETATSLPKDADGKAHLTFSKNGKEAKDGKEAKVTGTLGCNRVSATAKITDGHLTLSRPITTRMICPEPVMKVERALLRLFDGKQLTYELNHRGLTLTAPDGTGIAATAGKTATPAK